MQNRDYAYFGNLKKHLSGLGGLCLYVGDRISAYPLWWQYDFFFFTKILKRRKRESYFRIDNKYYHGNETRTYQETPRGKELN